MLGQQLQHSGFVAILGAPNAGKSTFLNKILNEKVAIVSPKAQTTRTKIKGVYTTASSQIVFTDTPGITPTDFGKLLNNWMNKYSFSAGTSSDIILLFVDISSQHPEIGIRDEEKNIIDMLDKNMKVILVANKSDVVKPMRATDTIALYKKNFPFTDSVIISASTGDGIEELLTKVTEMLASGPQYFPEDFVSDQEDEFLIGEIIREKIFLQLRQELPYSCAVTVESYRDHETKEMVLIDATIHVAKKSQKGMIIGAGGKTLGNIGSAARQELEDLFGIKVGMKLHVRIEKNWFEKETLLKKVGFTKDFE